MYIKMISNSLNQKEVGKNKMIKFVEQFSKTFAQNLHSEQLS